MYISTREMVISIICNACGVIGLILWAIEAHKSNASQSVESVESVDRKDEPQAEVKIEPSWVGETYGHFEGKQSGKE